MGERRYQCWSSSTYPLQYPGLEPMLCECQHLLFSENPTSVHKWELLMSVSHFPTTTSSDSSLICTPPDLFPFFYIPLNPSSATICLQKCGKILLACARGCFCMCDWRQVRFALCKFFIFRGLYFYSTGMDGKGDLMASESLSHLQPKKCYNSTLHRLRMLLKCSLLICTFWKFVLKNKEYGSTIKSQNTKIYILN